MKKIVSISLDKETINKINEILLNSTFRNKSHVVEEAIKKMWKNE